MKTRYLLPTLLTATVLLTATTAFASGQSYDPYENYYNQFYGMDSSTSQPEPQRREMRRELMKHSVAPVEKKAATSNGPYADYYGLYYSLDTQFTKTPESTSVSDSTDVADPANYYNW
jgi:hypothetical protein